MIAHWIITHGFVQGLVDPVASGVSVTYNDSLYNIDTREIEWTSEPEVISGYTLNIYRSQSPETLLTEYDLIASGVSPYTYAYQDTSLSGVTNPNADFFYKIEFEGAGALSGVAFPAVRPVYLHDSNTDKFHREILRRKRLVLDRYSGRTLYIIKKRSWGTRCTTCWDPNLYRVTNSHCTECDGTGWVDGYYEPMAITAMINAAPKLNQVTMFGEFMPSDAVLTMLDFPPLAPRDVVVDGRDRRWIIMQVRKLERAGFMIEQNCRLALISQEDIVYNISIS